MPIYIDIVHGDMRNHFLFNYKNIKSLIKNRGNNIKKIRLEIIKFIYSDIYKNFINAEEEFYNRSIKYGWNKEIEFWGFSCR